MITGTTSRRLRAWGTALLLVASAAGAGAADGDAATTHQAQYVRWHDSAVAFAETVDRISGRYEGLRSFDKTEALGLIAQGEQAAGRQDFDLARQYARQAYEILRSSIATAVGRPAR